MFSMRRPLVKLFVLFIAFIGLTGMFLYKLKYEQMKSIVDGAGLEAVDRFLHANYLLPSPSTIDIDSNFGFPPVSWSSISDHFVFSAFVCHDSVPGSSETREYCALGHGSDTEPAFGCSVWFDLGKEILSVPGTFSYSSDVTESSNVVYEFKCSVTNLKTFHRHPYMFVLKAPGSEKKILIPIYKPGKPSSQSTSVLCVYPDFAGYEWKWMIEFFTYHNIIGFTDIIAYDIGINYGFLEKMKKVIQLSKGGTLKSLSVIRWDFPSNDPASNILVEKDCIHRSFGASNITAILNWNQFFVLAKHHTVNALVNSLSDVKPYKTRLPAKRCCTDAIDDRRSTKTWPIILKKTLCIPNKEPGLLYVHPSMGSEVSSDDPRLADLLTYSQCQGLALSELVPVFSMTKFSSDIRSSDIMQIWEKSDVFSITSS